MPSAASAVVRLCHARAIIKEVGRGLAVPGNPENPAFVEPALGS